MKNIIQERLDIKDNNYSEIMFSLLRYYAISTLCKNKIVIDIACGTGYGSYILSQNAKTVIGIDINKDVVEDNNSKYNKDNLSFEVGRTSEINKKSKSIDVIVSCETIEHITKEELNEFLREVKRTLKKNGIFFVTTPNLDKTSTFEQKNPYHINELRMGEFREILQSNFKYVDIYYLDLNLVTYLRKATETSSKLMDIGIKDWILSNEHNEKTIYMAALCSDKSIKNNDLSSVLIDDNKTLNEILWNKSSINEDKEIKEKNEKGN